MWYVIQTITGKEQELVDVIGKVLDEKNKREVCVENGKTNTGKSGVKCQVDDIKKPKSFEKCFIIKRECVWRREGRYQVHIKPLFPSYVFVQTDTPDKLFDDLKRIPKLTKLLGYDGSFWTVRKEEEELLRKLVGNDPEFVVRRSLVEVNKDGEIISLEGILKEYAGRIVKKRLRKRVVVIEIPFLGEMKKIEIGIKVMGDKNGETENSI